jgi:ArsR family transcriptional regulator, arsenate/arsenite/antimonite-responsive transcriptional repressor
MIPEEIITLAKALADETRAEILKDLCCVWLSVNDIVDKLDGKVNQPTVSHHLKKLEEAELVIVRQEGRNRYYTLNLERMNVCCGVLIHDYLPGSVVNFVGVNTIPVVDKQ